MAMNSFHKYVSSVRKSKHFKPVVIEPGFEMRVAAEPKTGPTSVMDGFRLREFMDIVEWRNVFIFGYQGNIYLTHMWI
jgi:hypothetical protein